MNKLTVINSPSTLSSYLLVHSTTYDPIHHLSSPDTTPFDNYDQFINRSA